MKLIIDIPDSDYYFIKDLYQVSGGRMTAKKTQQNVINSIKNSTPYEERPTGEWIECEEWNETYYECSVCKEPWCTLDGTPVDNLMNYCPCCGARMEGVRKSEEEGEDE